MERAAGIYDRQDRLADMQSRGCSTLTSSKAQDKNTSTTTATTLQPPPTPNLRKTIMGRNAGMTRAKTRREKQQAQRSYHDQTTTQQISTLEQKGLHPIVVACEKIAYQSMSNNVPPTYNTIKSELVGRFGMTAFKQHKKLLVAVLAKLVPEHEDNPDIARIRYTRNKLNPTDESPNSSPSPSSIARNTKRRRSRKRSFQEFNSNLLHTYQRLQHIFQPHTNTMDFNRLSTIWDELATDVSPCSLDNPQWIQLGCSTCDPTPTFQQAGQLAIDCLLGMIQKENRAFQQILLDVRTVQHQSNQNTSHLFMYPLVTVVMELIVQLCVVFGLASFKPRGRRDRRDRRALALMTQKHINVLQIPRAQALSTKKSFENWFILSFKRFHRKMCLSVGGHDDRTWNEVLTMVIDQVKEDIDGLITIEEARTQRRANSRRSSSSSRSSSQSTASIQRTSSSTNNTLPSYSNNTNDSDSKRPLRTLGRFVTSTFNHVFKPNNRTRANSPEIVWSENVLPDEAPLNTPETSTNAPNTPNASSAPSTLSVPSAPSTLIVPSVPSVPSVPVTPNSPETRAICSSNNSYNDSYSNLTNRTQNDRASSSTSSVYSHARNLSNISDISNISNLSIGNPMMYSKNSRMSGYSSHHGNSMSIDSTSSSASSSRMSSLSPLKRFSTIKNNLFNASPASSRNSSRRSSRRSSRLLPRQSSSSSLKHRTRSSLYSDAGSELGGSQQDTLRLLSNNQQVGSPRLLGSPRHKNSSNPRRSRFSVEKRSGRGYGGGKRSSTIRAKRRRESQLSEQQSSRIPPPPTNAPNKSLMNLMRATYSDSIWDLEEEDGETEFF